VSEAKKHGIHRVHGFFVIGCPNESAEDTKETFRFAARLEVDTFGFNRLAVYRGTPLWKTYIEKGILDEERDWTRPSSAATSTPTPCPTTRSTGGG